MSRSRYIVSVGLFSICALHSLCGNAFPQDNTLVVPEKIFFSGSLKDIDDVRKSKEIILLPSAEDEVAYDCVTILPPDATESDIAMLRKAKSLEVLETRDINLTVAQLRQLKTLPKLKTLRFQCLVNASEKLKVIAEFPALENLEVSESDADDSIASSIAKMKKLKTLDLDGCLVTSYVFAEHMPPSTVETISIASSRINSHVFIHSRFPANLKILKIYGSVADRTVPDFGKLKNLRELDTGGMFSHSDLEEIRNQIPEVMVNNIRKGDLLDDQDMVKRQ
ncbi:hypothetical protein [Bremerella cremea]|nr:hypothetical protein [Bremerella cremea]